MDENREQNQDGSKNDEVKQKDVTDDSNPIIKKVATQDDAGPSSIFLPGAVPQSPKFHKLKPGISRSEHSMTHTINVITSKDVANALKMTSLSFGTNSNPKNIWPDIKVPIPDNVTENVQIDPTTMSEIQKLVADCFNRGTPAKETSVNIQAAPEILHEMPNSSCQTAQTENIPLIKFNNVIVTPTPMMNPPELKPVEPKQSKDKKDKGSLSAKSDLGLAQRDSLSSIGSNVCRICMTRGKERLISPCNCKGSLANVHLSCLERWLNQVGRNHCELCGYSYPAIRTPRYTVLQALRLWFGNPRNRSHLQSDCLIFWLLSTVTAGLLAVCIVGTQYFVIEGSKFGKQEGGIRKEEGISHRITETAMDFFMAVVLCGYSVTVYLLWKDHYVMWNRWRRANVNVRLLLSPDANPVPFLPRPTYNIV